MKKNYNILNMQSFKYFILLIVIFSGKVFGQVFSDNATNYGGSWSNESNQGTGFGAWSFTYGSNSGSFIGNPDNNGMGTSGIGTTAFGMYATGSGYFSAYRSINDGMRVGDILSFYWSINFDAGGGAKGFDLRSGGTTIFNVNNGGSATISSTNGTVNAGYGTDPMLVTLTRTSLSTYSFIMTSRSGGGTYSTTISSLATIDGFNFYIGNQNDGAGEKNMFVNAFKIEKPITIADGDWNTSSTWLNNTIPPTNATVTINHHVTLNTNVTLSKLTINSGKTFTASDSSPRVITFNKLTAGSEQTLTNNGTWANGTGASTVVFSGSPNSGDAIHQIDGIIGFQNILLEKSGGSSNVGASFDTGSIVSGTLEIGTGGFVSTAPPTGFYGTDAILKFDQGASATYNVELGDNTWSLSEVPNNITISSGTVSLNSDRTASGDLLIDGGSLNLNTSTLTIQGNWTRSSGGLNAGTSTVIFSGSQSAVFTVASESNLYNLTINKDTSAVTVTLDGDLAIGNSLTITNGTFEAETNTITYNGANQTIAATVDGVNYGNLTLSGSGIKTFSGNTTINGDFTVSSVDVVAPTTISFAGSGAQNIAGINYNHIEFSGSGTKTFTSNASVSPTSAITFGTGGATIDFDGASNDLEFVLQSTTDGSAQVDQVPSGYTLNGQVRAQRYIPAKRAWRLLTAPVKGSSNNSIFYNWQNNGAANDNLTGVTLWNPSGTTSPDSSNNGLFQGPQANIYSYPAAWQAVTNTNNANLFEASTNNAFLVFVTGPHAATNTIGGTPQITTLNPKGDLITGTVTKTLVADQFTLIGNPYASALNTEALVQANSGSKAWLLDPSSGNFGAYVAYDGINWSTPTTGNDAYIQSGQGFFVRTTGASFAINETHKVIGNSNTWFGFARTNATATQTDNTDKIRVLLYKQDNNQWQLADGILVVNSSTGNNDVDATDAPKISNFNESLMFRNGTSNLSIEYRALPQVGTVQPLRLTGTTVQPYQLRLYTENYSNSNLQPFLEDTTTGTFTPIPTDGSILSVPFTGVVSNNTSPDMRYRIAYQTVLNNEDFTPALATIYPNPVSEGLLNIHLNSNEGAASFVLNNLLGQVVYEGSLEQIQNAVKLPSLQKGFYLITVKQANKQSTSKIYIQ
ncbi:MAG: T9SS type A sorting domain-containing protein [Flavobacterium sp.]|nr:T9SS type A sorting domain-containing protein [Flavobacterium sp.]